MAAGIAIVTALPFFLAVALAFLAYGLFRRLNP